MTYSCHGYLLKAYHVLSAVLEIPQKTKRPDFQELTLGGYLEHFEQRSAMIWLVF